MPANVENMFSVKETPWHGIGSVVNEVKTSKEAIELSGANFGVEKRSMYFKYTDKDGNVVEVPMDECGYASVRMDNFKPMGILGPNTSILQNSSSFSFFDSIVESGEATFETAGVLDEGRKIWIMAKIAQDPFEVVKDDAFLPFILLSNSHDGTQAVRVGFTPIRAVCANTLAAAHKDKKSKLIRVRHSQHVVANLDNIKEVMQTAKASFEATLEQYKLLARKDINASDLRKYVKKVFGFDEDETKLKPRSLNTIQKVMDLHESRTGMLRELAFRDQLAARAAASDTSVKTAAEMLIESITEKFEDGIGTDNKASRGSWWTAYNAITEDLNYVRGHNQQTRLNSLWFGPNAKTSADALGTALEMAGI